MFGGYHRYDQAGQQWRRLRVVPWRIRGGFAASIPAVNLKAAKLREGVGAQDRTALYRTLVSNCWDPLQMVIGADAAPTRLNGPTFESRFDDFRDEMIWLDGMGYLPGDILAELDRARKSSSLESRIPMLDHRYIEFSWTLPAAIEWHDGRGKWPLRVLLDRHVPKQLTDRPKKGFGVPIARWLRAELKAWAEDLLSATTLRNDGWLDPDLVRMRWRLHSAGREDRSTCLWNILMFHSWLAEQKRSPGLPGSPGAQDRASSSL